MIVLLTFLLVSLSPHELLMKVDSVSRTPQSQGLLEETILTTSGNKRTFKIRYYSKNGNNKQLMVYLYPKPVEGTSFLMVEDNIWAYFPETGRIRKIASHAKRQKMMGSDFTYEDMEIENYSEKFRPGEVSEERDYYLLTLYPKKGEDISYAKLVLKIDKKTFVPVKVDFFRKGDEKPYKTLFQENIKDIEGIPTPMKITMVNNETGTRTEMVMEEITYNVHLEDNLFSVERLKEISE